MMMEGDYVKRNYIKNMSFRRKMRNKPKHKRRNEEEGNEYPEEDANTKSMRYSESVYDNRAHFVWRKL